MCFEVLFINYKKKCNIKDSWKNFVNCVIFTYLFMPISLMAEAGGPIKMIPLLAHSSANSTFSDKNP
jgi:hypothetical protein